MKWSNMCTMKNCDNTVHVVVAELDIKQGTATLSGASSTCSTRSYGNKTTSRTHSI